MITPLKTVKGSLAWVSGGGRPNRGMRVGRWSTKGRSAGGAPAVAASALLCGCRAEESCAQSEEDGRDWTGAVTLGVHAQHDRPPRRVT